LIVTAKWDGIIATVQTVVVAKVITAMGAEDTEMDIILTHNHPTILVQTLDIPLWDSTLTCR